jgi:hypothetical protein
MKTIRLAVPWSTSSYVPLNAFHPLYAPLFEGEVGDRGIEFSVLNEPGFYNELISNKELVAGVGRSRAQFSEELGSDEYWQTDIGKQFVDYHGINNLWLAGNIPGDIELHHTAPVSVGARPFVLHCESFHPVFSPFADEAKGFSTDIHKTREFYRALFSKNNCLGIGSHLDATLGHLSNFFSDSAIDKKLFLTGMGLSKNTLDVFSSQMPTKNPQMPCFLFTHSAQQNPALFVLRGGVIALLFMEIFYKSGGQGKFVFRCNRPDRKIIEEYGLDRELLKNLEDEGKLVWITQFLSEEDLLSLFTQADFFILPSANLHSVSLMQAQAAGAIPVVTDAIGVERYVTDGVSGVVLHGIRSSISVDSPASGVPFTDHQRWRTLPFMDLARQMYLKLKPLLDDPSRRLLLQNNIKGHALKFYEGADFREGLLENVRARYELLNVPRESRVKDCPIPVLDSESVRSKGIFGSPVNPKRASPGYR